MLALKPSTTQILPKTPESSVIAVVSKNSLLQVYHIKRIENKLDFIMGTQDAIKMRDEKKLAKKLNQIEQLKLKNATLSEFKENCNLSTHLRMLHSKLKTTLCC